MMIEHLTNCHGEWNMLFALLGSVPIVGVWFKHLKGEDNE